MKTEQMIYKSLKISFTYFLFELATKVEQVDHSFTTVLNDVILAFN